MINLYYGKTRFFH